MLATYFEWHVKAGREAEFERLWSAGTEALRHEGSLGSALFKSGDGRYHAFARWPDRATRDAAVAKRIRLGLFAPFQECIETVLAQQDMDLVDDQWLPT